MTTRSSSRHRSPSRKMVIACIKGVMSRAWWMVVWSILWSIGSCCLILQARKTRWRTLRKKVRISALSVMKSLPPTRSFVSSLPRPQRKNSTQTQDGPSKSITLLQVLTTLSQSLKRLGVRKWMSWSIWRFCRGKVRVKVRRTMSWKGMRQRMSALVLRRYRSRFQKSH